LPCVVFVVKVKIPILKSQIPFYKLSTVVYNFFWNLNLNLNLKICFILQLLELLLQYPEPLFQLLLELLSTLLGRASVAGAYCFFSRVSLSRFFSSISFFVSSVRKSFNNCSCKDVFID
jgi:hypothetical protein